MEQQRKQSYKKDDNLGLERAYAERVVLVLSVCSIVVLLAGSVLAFMLSENKLDLDNQGNQGNQDRQGRTIWEGEQAERVTATRNTTTRTTTTTSRAEDERTTTMAVMVTTTTTRVEVVDFGVIVILEEEENKTMACGHIGQPSCLGICLNGSKENSNGTCSPYYRLGHENGSINVPSGREGCGGWALD